MAILIQIWDRKSPRHKWQLAADTFDQERIDALTPILFDKLVSWAENTASDGWENAQLGVNTREVDPGGWERTRENTTAIQNASMHTIINVKDHI